VFTYKRALISSTLALLMCVAMLIGTTFAWFTDTASTAVNKIQAGNLDVDLEMSTDGTNWESAEGKTLTFKTKDNRAADQILWEPGCTYELPQLRVVNKGNLALKYKIQITGIQGDAKLNEVIDWTINDAAIDLTEGHLTAGQTGTAFTIKGHMQDAASNDYQNLAIDGIGITVYATQDTVENDSFDNQYDKDAEYPIVAMDTLQELINNATEPVSAKLEGNIAGSLTIPEDKNITLDLNGFTLTGGDSHAILNRGTLCIKDSSGNNGKIVASKANTSALRNAAVCVIEGGTFTRADGEDNKWHTVENFGTMTFNGGKVIAEDGQSFAIVNGWNYIDPGKQKATMTINNIEMKAAPNGLKNCAGGTLTMNGGTLHCTGYWGLSNDSTGIATINGGNITSDSYIAISNGGAKMEINGGTFSGPQGSLFVQTYAQGTVVKGGSYQGETEEFMQGYCPDGYTAKLDGGMVVVSKN
jgi:predicted ribosomally synthesized peptide with SipW-like signal peptide